MADPVSYADQDGLTITLSDVSNYTSASLPANQTITVAENTYDPAFYVATGTVDNAIERSADWENDAGTFDRQNGSASTDSELYVNAAESTTVIYSSHTMACVFLNRCTNSTIHLTNARYAAYAVRLQDCDNIDVIVDGDSHHLGHGVYIVRSTNVRVHDSIMRDIRMAGIQCFGDCDGTVIEDNIIMRPCYGESTGGIYGGTTTGYKKVRRNVITEPGYGVYWPNDGGGIYADNYSWGWDFQHNTVIDPVGFGWLDNSGWGGNNYLENTFINCGERAGKRVNSRELQWNKVSDVGYYRNLLVNSDEAQFKRKPTDDFQTYDSERNITGTGDVVTWPTGGQ